MNILKFRTKYIFIHALRSVREWRQFGLIMKYQGLAIELVYVEKGFNTKGPPNKMGRKKYYCEQYLEIKSNKSLKLHD